MYTRDYVEYRAGAIFCMMMHTDGSVRDHRVRSVITVDIALFLAEYGITRYQKARRHIA